MKYFLLLVSMFWLAPLNNRSFGQALPPGAGTWECLAEDSNGATFSVPHFGFESDARTIVENQCLIQSLDPDSCEVVFCAMLPTPGALDIDLDLGMGVSTFSTDSTGSTNSTGSFKDCRSRRLFHRSRRLFHKGRR